CIPDLFDESCRHRVRADRLHQPGRPRRQLRRHHRRRGIGRQLGVLGQHLRRRQAGAGRARRCSAVRGQRWRDPRRPPGSGAAPAARIRRRRARGQRPAAGAGDPRALTGVVGAAGRVCLLALLLAVAAPLPAALRIEIEAEGLTDAELRQSHALVAHAQALLPDAFARELDTAVALRWRDDLPQAVHGRARAGRIGLRRDLLQRWVRRDIAAGDADPDARAALAALLHELAHVHDRSARGGLSRDPRLLDLAGWPVQPLRLGLRASRNDFRDRTPDAYELASPAEFVAVNFEHFLLDPGYACARPALHRHFVARFGPPPALPGAVDCPAGLPFVAAGEDDAMLQALDLDPARVHAVDYLFAEASDRPMSRWGHAMLRLVVCAPGRTPGPDCRLDLQHHVVLSFRAFVDDVQVSSWRGLTGAYPARLFVLPLGQVVDEYTRVELRGLQSIPLRLDEAGIRDLLGRAARVHWSYDGRYRFVGNNCAVETWKLLNDGVPRLAQARLRSITPTGLRRRLVRAGIADASVLADAPHALREGYRFASL